MEYSKCISRRFAAIAAIALSCTMPAPAEDPPPQAVPKTLALADPAKSAVNWTWRQLTEGGATLTLSSSATAPTQVTVDAANFAIRGGVVSLTVTPVTATIPAFGTTLFTLQALGSRPAPGIYTGVIRIQDGGKGLPPVQATLTVPGPELLVSKKAVTLWRKWPIPNSCLWNAQIPLPLTGSGGLDGLEGRLVGAVRSDNGGWAAVRVRWKEGAGTSPVGQPALVIDRPRRPGKYDGDLILADVPTKVQLALSVTVKDIFVWPALVILLGTSLAYFVKRYIGVLRITRALRLQEAELGETFRQGQTKFAEIAVGQAFGAYSLAVDFDAQRRNVLAHLDTIERSPITNLDSSNKDYQAALTTLKALEDAIALWPDFAAGLASLSDALDQVQDSIDGSAMEPPTEAPGTPQFFGPAQGTLAGRAVTISELSSLNSQVAASVEVATLWPTVRKRAADLTADFRALSHLQGLPPAASTLLGTALNLIVSLWATLGAVQDAAGLNGLLAVGGAVNQTRIQIDQIRAMVGALAPPVPAPAANIALFAMGVAGPSVGDRFRAALDLHLPASDRRRAEVLQQSIGRGDFGASAFAFVIGLLTGLNQFYLGTRPFGTVADYVTVFLWAAGTKVALDMLLTVVDKLNTVARRP